MRRLGLGLACLALLGMPGGELTSADDKAASPGDDAMASLERFIGEWTIEGRWESGEELRARGVYEWGLGRKIVKAQTYVKDGGKEYQRYESVLAWHPRKKSLYEITFAFDGAINEVIVDAKDKDAFRFGWTSFDEAQPSRVRQTTTFQGRDRFVWKVELKTDDGAWKPLIEATWKRKGT